LFSISFIDAKGQYNKLLNKSLSIRFIITAITDGTKKVEQQGDKVMDSRSLCADIPLETAHRKVALEQYTSPQHD